MKIEELIQLIKDAETNGDRQILLVVPRKTPPKKTFISVKGMGKGFIVNVNNGANGCFDVVAYFKTETIKKSLIRGGQL